MVLFPIYTTMDGRCDFRDRWVVSKGQWLTANCHLHFFGEHVGNNLIALV
jgi:hypothetical protein